MRLLLTSCEQRVASSGIRVGATYIFGLPDETPATMQQTLDLACDLGTEWANFDAASLR